MIGVRGPWWPQRGNVIQRTSGAAAFAAPTPAVVFYKSCLLNFIQNDTLWLYFDKTTLHTHHLRSAMHCATICAMSDTSDTPRPRKLNRSRAQATPVAPLAKPQRTPRGPSPQKTEATRATIIDAAYADFLERGYARSTMQGVAQRAGLSKVTLFRYFESKEALFDSVVQRHIASAAFTMQHNMPAPGELVGDFLLRTLVPVMERLEKSGRAATARFVVAEGLEFPQLAQMYVRHAHLPLVARIRSLTELAHARGELLHPQVHQFPEQLLSPLWLGMMNNAVLQPHAKVNTSAMFQLQIALMFRTSPSPANGQ